MERASGALHAAVNPNKLLKEQFVSNLTGSSMLEIAALSTIVPALVVLRQCSDFYSVDGENNCLALQCVFYSPNVRHDQVKPKKGDDVKMVDSVGSWRRYMILLVVDYVTIIFPILSIFTIFSDWATVCGIAITFLLLLFLLTKRILGWNHTGDHSASSLRKSLMSYRVSMMVVTCICILAVDFKVFPRRYAKTETYGTGLMDLGVGSFVLANALVSRQARNSTSGEWKTALKSSSPLIMLGFGRLIFTKGVDYQVHVGEYGVHWNFFFTLAAVSLLTSFIRIHPRYCGIFGLFILSVYEICLLCGLNNYLLSNERTSDIISLNKEGIFSIFGYWGMYLFGVHLGYSLFFMSSATEDVPLSRMKVWFLSAIFWFLTVILDKYVERVSRRMCNLAYVTLVLAQNFQVLSILTVSDMIPGKKVMLLEEAFNRNLLGVFLLANVLTGTVNLYVDTLSVSSSIAFGILSGYALVLTAFAGAAGFVGLKLKF